MVNCPECSGPISAGKVEVNGVDYHPKCFFCKKCAIPLKVTSFKTVKTKFYCLNCVDKTPDLYHAERAEAKARQEASSPSSSKPNQATTSPTSNTQPQGCCTIQ